MYAQEEMWEAENERFGFFHPWLTCMWVDYSKELKSDWNLVDPTDAVWNCAQIIAQFKIIPNFKDCWAEGIFFSSLRLFSCECWCLKTGYRQNSLAMWVILLYLAPKLLSLSAFQYLAFHFGACTWKAKHVNSIRERTLLEWKKTLTQACYHPSKCQNNSPGSCKWREMALWSCSTELTPLRDEPHTYWGS